MKPRPVIAIVVLSIVGAISASILAFARTSSVSTNQVTFKGSGSGTFNSQSSQFSFSVQCYGPNCVGALSFGGPSESSARPSTVNYVMGTVTQVQQDTYMMALSTPQAPAGTLPPTGVPSISCSLANTPPITQGETNTVTETCSSPLGSGVSQDAVVEVAPSIVH